LRLSIPNWFCLQFCFFHVSWLVILGWFLSWPNLYRKWPVTAGSDKFVKWFYCVCVCRSVYREVFTTADHLGLLLACRFLYLSQEFFYIATDSGPWLRCPTPFGVVNPCIHMWLSISTLGYTLCYQASFASYSGFPYTQKKIFLPFNKPTILFLLPPAF